MTQAYLDADTLLSLSQRATEENAEPFDPLHVDLGRPFIHEEFTQLSHTPFYAELDDAQRLRYNQLSGMSSNELFMMFESGFTNRVIQRLIGHRMLRHEPVLRQCLEIMLEEEKAHTRMFATLNRKCMPGIYSRTTFHFTRSGLFEKAALWSLTHLPHHLLLVVWLVMIMEEFSNYISRRMIRSQETRHLGTLDPAFVELHHRHLRDEARHVQIDANLIARMTELAGPLKRRSNARILRFLMDQILMPRRAGVAVIRHLVTEHPELKTRENELIASLRRLKREPGFANALCQEGEMKLTRLFMAQFPEYHFIETYAH